MTNKQGEQISWLEYRSQVTGKTVEEIREIMRERARAGGRAGKWKELSEEHKEKLRQAALKNAAK